jgi:ELWxxDGT repeat protein
MKKTLLSLLLCSSFGAAFSQTISWVPTSSGSVTASGSWPHCITVWNGKLYFWNNDSTSTEIWSYDEVTQPKKLTSISTSIANGYGGGKFAALNGKLYTAGSELLSYNGASVLTQVSNIFPGNSASPSGMTTINGKVYFTAKSSAGGGQLSSDLYSYDGVNPPVKYNIPGPSTGIRGCSPGNLTVFNSKLYFSVKLPSGKTGLYELDPVTNTPNLITNGAPAGDFSGSLAGTNEAGSTFLVAGGKFYFIGGEAGYASEVWSYDGSTLKRMTDVAPGLGKGAENSLGYYNGEVYFSGSTDGSKFQLYKISSDGKAVLVYTVNPSGTANLQDFITYKNNLYFIANTAASGAELWKYNGTSCSMVADLYPDVGSVKDGDIDYAIYNGHLYFQGSNGKHNNELFRLNDPTGIENVAWSGSVSVHPNPATTSASLTLILRNPESLQITITDITGREVYSTGVRNYAAGEHAVTLPLNALAAGQYIYRVGGSNGELLVSGKLIKE